MNRRMSTVILGLLGWLTVVQTGWGFYNPSTGRWLNRDPIGERGGMNLYSFNDNNAVSKVDPNGRQAYPWDPSNPRPDGKSDCEKFEEWYQKEKQDMSWMAALPNCPCKLTVGQWACSAGGGKSLNVSSDQDAGWNLDSDIVGIIKDTPAKHCIRSMPGKNDSRQQCCYDSDGNLITGGAGAGTVDRRSGPMDHVLEDFFPARWASQCDKTQGGNENIKKYLEVRPINNGNNCPENKP